MDAKEFDYHQYLDYLEENQIKKFLGVLSKELTNSVEDFVQFLNQDNISKFSSNDKQNVVLVT